MRLGEREEDDVDMWAEIGRQVTRVARLFPMLDTADGLEPFDPRKLERWAIENRVGHGCECAVRFVLDLFEHGRARTLPPFDVFEAMRCWDARHQAAFAIWAECSSGWV